MLITFLINNQQERMADALKVGTGLFNSTKPDLRSVQRAG